jgi:hypothetical protein
MRATVVMMSWKSFSGRRAAASALGALALVLSACGGEDDAQARQACFAEAKNAAEAAAIARLYERGELGPRAQVRRDLSGNGLRFFDDSGGMIPYPELDARERSEFNRWKNSAGYFEATITAREQARDSADPDC